MAYTAQPWRATHKLGDALGDFPPRKPGDFRIRSWTEEALRRQHLKSLRSQTIDEFVETEDDDDDLQVEQQPYAIQYADASGQVNRLTHYADEDLPLEDFCGVFGRGTLIETDQGPVAIEDIRPGVRVVTKDAGHQPVRWHSGCYIGFSPDVDHGTRRPVRIMADSFGHMKPMQDLVTTSRARVLLARPAVETMFGQAQMLAPIRALINGDSVLTMQGLSGQEFFNFALDTHQIVYANGIETESFHPGTYGVATMPEALQFHISKLFPYMEGDMSMFGPLCRQRLRAFEAAALPAR